MVAAITHSGGLAAQEQAAVEQEIVVTGSRIARSNDTTSTPLQVLSAQALEDEGAIDIGQSINNIPAVGNVNLSLETSNTGQYNAGITGVNLRALGEMRTLVLVNGRRYVSGIQNQGVVDLATIPPELVERVEVMTGGASAVYGSDAIGGVVNVLLRKRFEGLRFDTQFGQSAEGDGESRKVSILAGTISDDERMSAMGYIGYNDSEGISAADRDFSKDTILLNNLGAPDTAIVGPAANSAVTGRQTVFFPNSTNASATAIRTVVLPDGTLAPYSPARDGLNVQEYRLLRMPAKRYQLAGIADYKLTDNVRFFLETNFARSETDAEIQPTFFQTGSTANIGGASPTAIPVTIPVDNPFIPEGIRSQIPAGRTSFGFGRLLYELGARSYSFDRDTYRAVAGLDGKFGSPFGDDDWRWEASYTYGKTSIYILQHLASIVNMYDSLRVEADPAGGYRCTDVAARARGCVPVNLFTGQAFTAQDLAWLSADGSVNSNVDQQVVSATLSGNIFSLPAGEVGAAVGVEWREENSTFSPDTAFSNGLLTGAQQFPVSGKFDVREAFVEINVPVLKDLPLINRLELEAAFRTADYSSVGKADSWKFGGSWKPIEDLRLRAVKARAVRAPNIGELYAPPTYGGASALDPCSGGGRITGLDPATAATRQAYCASIGITSAYVQPNPIVFTYSGGNPNLDAETADTLTLGLVYTPQFLPGASLSVDYYDIAIDDAMGSLGTQLLMDRCADTGGDPFFCDNITRSTTTLEVTRVDNQQLNVATLTTKGIDFEVGYQLPLESINSNLGFGLNYTHLMEYESQPLPGATVVVSDGLSTYPGDKANLRIGFDRGPLHVALIERYVGETKRILTLDFAGNDIPAYFYTDAQVRYTHNEKFSAYLGVNNLFDKTPPIIPVGYPGNVFGYNTDPRTYDALGRMMYVGVSAKF
jgi:outer membrane receptor protein involved in Fe transport